ncbi:alpha/beta hydrolase-fold protein [Nocardia camponoti]|uniref:Protein PS1 n=1 Tax=Nocardia camponoti TaxID=1616106 RepID=A0A917VAL2_9NOCA|nr:alpha/beta hydrolase-fold protein [Nocardia camponoti]GGK55527.1 protein PS1 [Nocardia camponoti]
MSKRGVAASLRRILGLAAVTAALLAPTVVVPVAQSQPGVAEIQRVEWLSDRRVALTVHSPAMNTPIQVQMLLARDWNSHPDAKFPMMLMLDGLRAMDDENGWTKDADAEGFYADKNVNVVLPVGGQSSWYTDWLSPDNGRTYKWETFLTKELPPLLERDWRTTDVRGVEGLSMGGTAAMNLAGRNPGLMKFVASYSGLLTTTTLGMPQAIGFANKDAGGFDAVAMWGPPGGPEWAAHDPYLLADQLKGVSMYVSSGSGLAGTHDHASADVPLLSDNWAGTGLEILSRLSTQNFVAKLEKLAIPVQASYRPAGTHTWPYWDFEMRQSWPQAAKALGVDEGGAECGAGGAIGGVAQVANWLGNCLTGEYHSGPAIVQDFANGRVFFSPATGAHPVSGRIGGAYTGFGGASSPLGLPTGEERGLPDGRGRLQTFEGGSIYWTPQTGAQVIRGALLDAWDKQGFEGGPLGYPTAAEARTPSRDGAVQSFEHGPLFYSAATGVHRVQGFILDKYGQLGFENSPLGFPVADEAPIKDFGHFSRFEGGSIYWSPLSGAWSVRNGPVSDAWAAQGFENGRLGYPTSDEFPVAGGVQQNFQTGFIVVRDGKPEVHGV